MLSTLLEAAARCPAPVVLVLAVAVLAVESGTVLGTAVPGTTVAVALGLWSSLGGTSTAACAAAAALGTVTGAHVGWWRGRGGVVVPARLAAVRGVRRPLGRARGWLRHRDGVPAAVLLAAGHWASVLRPVVPRVAGAAGIGYRWAGPALAVSGTVWAVALVGLGARLGPVVARHAGWVTLPVVAVVVLVVALRTRRGQPTRSSNSPALAPCTNAEISAGV